MKTISEVRNVLEFKANEKQRETTKAILIGGPDHGHRLSLKGSPQKLVAYKGDKIRFYEKIPTIIEGCMLYRFMKEEENGNM